MNKNIYPWLTPLWQQWQQLLRQDTIANAMLCCADKGTAVEQIVARLVAAIVCRNQDGDACGLCHSCELSQAQQHPDIHWVVPEKEGKGLNVEQIREANKWALESSQLAGKRVIVIHPAEAMNESAANALLKTLETPPQQCVFILISHAKHKLLPTITSRCQLWQLATIEPLQLQTWLQLQSDKHCDWFCLKMYADSPLQALEFITNDGQQQFYQLIDLLLEASSSPVLNLPEIQKFFSSQCEEKVRWLVYLLADIQKAHFALSLPQVPASFERLVVNIDYQTAYQMQQQGQILLQQLQQHTGLNRELLVSQWFIQFKRSFSC